MLLEGKTYSLYGETFEVYIYAGLVGQSHLLWVLYPGKKIADDIYLTNEQISEVVCLD